MILLFVVRPELHVNSPFVQRLGARVPERRLLPLLAGGDSALDYDYQYLKSKIR